MNLAEYWQSKCWRAVLAVASSAHAESISGRAHVLDGDTVEVAGLRVRLIGIVAPESHQTCTAAGREWPCGADATKAVRAMIGGRRVECTVHGRDRYSRALAACFADGSSINAAIVQGGRKLARPKNLRIVEASFSATGAPGDYPTVAAAAGPRA